MRKIAFMLMFTAVLFTVSCDSKDELPNEDNQEENDGNKEDDDKEDKFYLRVGSQNVSLRNTDFSFYVDITSNTEWSIKIDQGIVGGNPAMGGGDIPAETWLTAPNGWSGVGNDRIMFTLTAYEGILRVGYVNISYKLSDGSFKTIPVTVSQSHAAS